MHKRILIVAVAIIAFIGTLSIGISEYKTTDIDKPISASKPIYQFGEYRGRVAVFKYEEKIPLEVLGVMLTSLPEYDQHAIKKGVYAYSDAELQNLIEDYDS